jgi:hypothetical protein
MLFTPGRTRSTGLVTFATENEVFLENLKNEYPGNRSWVPGTP